VRRGSLFGRQDATRSGHRGSSFFVDSVGSSLREDRESGSGIGVKLILVSAALCLAVAVLVAWLLVGSR
jgi:sorbitol-specific phosphotransferase system component IIBC